MNKPAIYTITSSLHNETAVRSLSDEFLKGIFPDEEYEFKGADSQYTRRFYTSILYACYFGFLLVLLSLLFYRFVPFKYSKGT